MSEESSSGFGNLLSPLKIKHPGGALTLRNRVLVSAHVPGFAKDNLPGRDYIEYHRRYAAEGVGLQITGGTPVHKSGLLSLQTDALWNLDESIVPGYQQLSKAIHSEGGRMLAQLAHSGGTVKIDQPGIATWSASEIRSSITGHVSHAMSVDEIQEVIAAHAKAAGRVHQGELDGVEILAAFGFLPQAFLSPLTNHRKDEYGGTLSNRLRFLIELLTAVRAELGNNQILGVRLPGDEFEPGGLTLQDMKLVCKTLSDKGLIDYLNITAHTNFTPTGRSKHWAPTPTKHGVFVELASAIKAEVTVPVFTVGRIVDPSHAERIIANGQADMVGMTRAHICDPTIISKIKNRKTDQIRPCVGANTCIANRYAGKTIRCMHNPELKAPGKVLHPVKVVKQITIVGGGPAGLEAARLCAVRGHKVTLFEATSAIGGQLRYWAKSTSMAELGRIISWRQKELDRLGVSITLQQKILPQDLKQMDTDVMILATGAKEQSRQTLTDHSVPALTPLQVLEQQENTATHAIVVNDGRGQAGLIAAEWLLERGCKVEIISEDVAVASDLDPTNRNAWYERLGRAGCVFTPQSIVDHVHSGVVHLKHLFSQVSDERTSIDLLVDWNGCRSENQLCNFAESIEKKYKIHSIGDCVSPRGVELAMAEALNITELV